MVSVKELQQEYNKLYIILREYVWPMYVVENLADLEISIYQAFPDKDLVLLFLNRLASNINKAIPVEEDQIAANNCIDKIRDLCNEGPIYYKVYQVNEVIPL